jgi:hypothetical protein
MMPWNRTNGSKQLLIVMWSRDFVIETVWRLDRKSQFKLGSLSEDQLHLGWVTKEVRRGQVVCRNQVECRNQVVRRNQEKCRNQVVRRNQVVCTHQRFY